MKELFLMKPYCIYDTEIWSGGCDDILFFRRPQGAPIGPSAKGENETNAYLTAKIVRPIDCIKIDCIKIESIRVKVDLEAPEPLRNRVLENGFVSLRINGRAEYSSPTWDYCPINHPFLSITNRDTFDVRFKSKGIANFSCRIHVAIKGTAHIEIGELQHVDA